MKIASFRHAGSQGFGPVVEGRVADVSSLLGTARLADMLGRDDFQALIADAAAQAPSYALDAIEMLPPVPEPGRIICVGLNYRTHIAEMGREPGAHPAIFFRYPDSIVGHGAPMIRPQASAQYDYEGELAFVIGRGGRHLAGDEALAAVAGYTAFNDGSVRDWQRHTQQFGPGKTFFRSGACGPWLVTADEIPDLGTQTLTTRLNGAVMQHARLDDLLFGVAALVSYLSTIFPLRPGDIVATGTTGGVGAARTPPVWMKPGDRVKVAISGIGTLSNPVEDEGA